SSRRRHTRCLSDWSSDVCSSDLLLKDLMGVAPPPPTGDTVDLSKEHDVSVDKLHIQSDKLDLGSVPSPSLALRGSPYIQAKNLRSEERRVGKECRYRREECR